jgi:glyoxylase-like metal-dependent hydrolase (beta-lactamase superfamily II)
MNRSIAAIVLCAFIAGVAEGQALPKKIEVEKVAEGVYVLYGNGGNIGVSAGPDGVILIDDQYAQATPQVLEALATLDKRPPRFVLNTHWHGDHTGGNENLAKQASVIVAHEGVRARMSTEQNSDFLKHKTPAAPPLALPVVTFNDGLSLHLNGEELRGYHAPQAHTDGDTVVVFKKANVIHTGDVFFHGMYPFIDLDSGGSVSGLIAAVDKVLELADEKTRIIPGHGKLTDQAALASYRKMLVETSSRVQLLVKSGKSLAEVQASKPNADYDATLAWEFISADFFAHTLYEDARRRVK